MTHADILEITGETMQGLKDRVARKEVHDEVAASLAIGWAQVKERESVYMVSSGIADEAARRLGFTPFPTIQAALDAALERTGPAARIAVLTHAPDMLPVIGK